MLYTYMIYAIYYMIYDLCYMISDMLYVIRYMIYAIWYNYVPKMKCKRKDLHGAWAKLATDQQTFLLRGTTPYALWKVVKKATPGEPIPISSLPRKLQEVFDNGASGPFRRDSVFRKNHNIELLKYKHPHCMLKIHLRVFQLFYVVNLH